MIKRWQMYKLASSSSVTRRVLTLIIPGFQSSQKPGGGSIVPPLNIFVNTCDGTMKLGMHVCMVIVYIVRRILARKGSKMELGANNWKPMPHCSPRSRVIPKKKFTTPSVGGATFLGVRTPPISVFILYKINRKRQKKKVISKIKYIQLPISGCF